LVLCFAKLDFVFCHIDFGVRFLWFFKVVRVLPNRLLPK
jgi:hypothetical protein